MTSKMIIGSLVGALILFIWQFISWSLGNHNPHMQYTANQDKIIETISQNIDQEGTYFIPRANPSLTPGQQQEYSNTMIGKPWAVVTYHKNFQDTFVMNLIRGFIIDFVSVFMLVWVLSKFRESSFSTVLISSIMVGLIGYFTINYLDTIWFKSNSIPYLIDALVSWGIIGAWLGWWLNRK